MNFITEMHICQKNERVADLRLPRLPRIDNDAVLSILLALVELQLDETLGISVSTQSHETELRILGKSNIVLFKLVSTTTYL